MSGNGVQGIWDVRHSYKNGESGEIFTLCGFEIDGCMPFTEKFTTLAEAQEKAIKIDKTHFNLCCVRSFTQHTIVWNN